MCGIAGCIVAPGTRPPQPALEDMAAALAHRGPDDRGVQIAANVGLVNTRLAIVDPTPAGHQPITDPSGGWVLTYNGEIFNHAAIREELSFDGWRGGSDSCNGFFALAALDLARDSLLLARDRFGVKPLYLARHDGGLWFASEIRALLAAGIPARARTDVLAHAVSAGWVAGRQTPLDGVERLPPGGLAAVDTKTLAVRERRWFEPSQAVDPELANDLASLRRGELGDRLEAALRSAVQRRLLGDVPIGAACSGGLDSTLVTAFARDADRSIVAFNVSLADEPREDEGRWGELAARALDVELETVDITAAQWRAALVEGVAHHEYPLTASGSSIPIMLMARRARERGVKVLLTGEAADELFGGYTFLHGAEFRDFLPARLMLRRWSAETRGPHWPAPIRRLLLASLRSRFGPRRRASPPPEVAASRERSRKGAERAYAHHPGARGRLEAALLSWLSSGSFLFLLNRMDKDAMAHSVETRIPFLDPEVVQLALNLPLEHRVGPSPKGLLREVAWRRLPAQIVNRPKQMGMVFRTGERIAEAAQADFLERGYLRDLLQLPADRWRRLADGARSGARLWTAEIWCRLFLEGQEVAAIERELWVPELLER